MFALTVAFVVWFIGNTCMVAAGVNVVRWLRLMGVGGWAGYIAGGGWAFFGLFGFVRMLSVLVQLYTSGIPPTYTGLPVLTIISLSAGLAFTFFLAVSSYVALSNTRKMQTQKRAELLAAHNELWKLKGRLNV